MERPTAWRVWIKMDGKQTARGRGNVEWRGLAKGKEEDWVSYMGRICQKREAIAKRVVSCSERSLGIYRAEGDAGNPLNKA